MTPEEELALLRELASLRDKCTAMMGAIGDIQLMLARRAADRAETQRIERAEFGPQTRTTLDE
jgi:hypothetical protein